MNHQQTIQHFRDTFAKAAENRKAHETLVPHPLGRKYGHTVPQWHLNEMQIMLNEINHLRREARKEPIKPQQLFDAEVTACGHVDYAIKLSIYATELAEKP
jgi:hypothetical protein